MMSWSGMLLYSIDGEQESRGREQEISYSKG